MNTEELKKLAMAATPGPWYDRAGVLRGTGGGIKPIATIYNGLNSPYIAAANPTAILALIEQHEAVNSELLATRDDNHSMMLEIEGLRKARDKLLAALELFMERVDEPPESNCSCHLFPPCNDCVEYSGLREAFSDAHDAIAKAEG